MRLFYFHEITQLTMSTLHISFIIPAFNAAMTITESVDSIFDGNFAPGDEVIIVNDCSTDATSDVLNNLKEQYEGKLTILHNEINKGCPASRNVGIRTAKNELIFNLDSDNILTQGSVQKLKTALVENKADLVTFSDYRYFVDDVSRITHYWYCNPGWFTTADLFAGHVNPGPGGNFLYTKASWQRVGEYWEYGKGLHEAWGFTLKQLMSGSKLFVVPETHYYHRHGHESLFVSESKNKPGEIYLLQKMLAPFERAFPKEEWGYMQSNPNWYSKLDERPITLTSSIKGKNGRLKVTWYGNYKSIVRRLQSVVKFNK